MRRRSHMTSSAHIAHNATRLSNPEIREEICIGDERGTMGGDGARGGVLGGRDSGAHGGVCVVETTGLCGGGDNGMSGGDTSFNIL